MYGSRQAIYGTWAIGFVTPDARLIFAGGGPSGLLLVRLMKRSGYDVTLLEARNPVWGRVMSERCYDLRPACPSSGFLGQMAA